ncbi:hypothetical protein CGMCC3_g16385 [Colletotrichum fructicola]|uniref:Uncharacterized protein n=1 Tax=Colletotrichum fructicola (strain Nara gc5) TaxID=1213859 RepID=A0A7J6IES3_COLFN|nr:uncharacterized protein CGMCC3_g16385 [Colletotrichum fructicola]KAE9567464.1 hypothetical protein CGMCC3_g16385 [Colletotrichum fructicola]KAF4415874.1 hypothetical protein CFRS1_v016124 [Colletotrichum fructicola]KAF4474531.1 hypothetical protein CGGC5_v017178 [Colletotrichum fructicola Nara gc5]KAF4879486.1 hypothetical protein CGCFRS4_v016097 [Colletotrichum fructicola]
MPRQYYIHYLCDRCLKSGDSLTQLIREKEADVCKFRSKRPFTQERNKFEEALFFFRLLAYVILRRYGRHDPSLLKIFNKFEDIAEAFGNNEITYDQYREVDRLNHLKQESLLAELKAAL